MEINIKAGGSFGRYLVASMEKNGVDVRYLAALVDCSYESIRRLILGTSFPSPWTMQEIAKHLKDFDKEKAGEYVARDKMEKKYGSNYNKITQLPAGMNNIVKDWDYLSPEQQKTLAQMTETMARTNMGRKDETQQ